MGIISHAMVSKWEEMGVLDELRKENEIEKLKKELDRTRKALDYATTMLERIAVSPETMLEPEKIVPQLAGQALEQINKIKGGKDV